MVNEKPVEHSFDSTAEAYNMSQTWDAIQDGDILIVPSENVVGVMIEAWPVAVSENTGEFHKLDDDIDWSAIPTLTDTPKDYSQSFEMAVNALDRLRNEF